MTTPRDEKHLGTGYLGGGVRVCGTPGLVTI